MRPAAPERKKHTKSFVTAGGGNWPDNGEVLAVFRGVAGDCGVKRKFRETRFIVLMRGEEGQLRGYCPRPSRRAFSHPIRRRFLKISLATSRALPRRLHVQGKLA